MPSENCVPCERLDWDSTFFGFPAARVCGDTLTRERLAQIDDWCARSGVACLYFLARADDPETAWLAQAGGFQLVDVRMTFEWNAEWDRPPEAPAAKPLADASAGVRPARPGDVPALESIARECHTDSRFFFDPAFPREKCAALYETWIRRSCEGYAQAVLVAECGGAPAGYVSCHLGPASDAGRIGLVGVDRRARGGGLGPLLVRRALEWFSARGVRQVSVVTQGRNVAAQRLYQRCGFQTQAIGLWYHKWYRAPELRHE
ncbi:MAG TPA: GNAT family N-acetyltransferase [Bryobacterales bacterium]|nr:GNAT family N-acetyltransferase [Bryobacterales bacterium]